MYCSNCGSPIKRRDTFEVTGESAGTLVGLAAGIGMGGYLGHKVCTAVFEELATKATTMSQFLGGAMVAVGAGVGTFIVVTSCGALLIGYAVRGCGMVIDRIIGAAECVRCGERYVIGVKDGYQGEFLFPVAE